MRLSVKLVGKNAKLMRDRTEIGGIKLDHHWQLAEVTIASAATPEEGEQIIRLASSHAAQFLVDRGEDYRPISGSTPERSRRLLDFGITAPQHTKLSVGHLESALKRLGVKVKRS